MEQQLELDTPVIVAGDGTATTQVGPNIAGEQWSVDAIGCSATPGPAGAATIAVYVNGIFRVGSIAAQADTAGGDPPIELQAGETLELRWAACSPGTRANAHLSGTRYLP